MKDLLQVKIHFNFKSSVRGTLANWKLFLCDVRALVKQFGIPTYFLALSLDGNISADISWEGLLYIINKLNNLVLSDKELENLSYINDVIY